MKRPALRSFGSRVKQERQKQNLSQEALADKAGLHRTYLGDVERGERNIGLLNIVKIANALNIPPDLLLRGPDSRGGS